MATPSPGAAQSAVPKTLYERLVEQGIKWCRYCGTTTPVHWRGGPWGANTLCKYASCHTPRTPRGPTSRAARPGPPTCRLLLTQSAPVAPRAPPHPTSRHGCDYKGYGAAMSRSPRLDLTPYETEDVRLRTRPVVQECMQPRARRGRARPFAVASTPAGPDQGGLPAPGSRARTPPSLLHLWQR